MKVLIVDDSALMRKYLRTLFEGAGNFETYTARNGKEALEVLAQIRPDVITLDINMPEMDGLDCLSRIMVAQPVPVVMISSLTQAGALATLEAMHLGAVDYVPKPGGTVSLNLDQIGALIVQKVVAAAGARVRASYHAAPTPPPAIVERNPVGKKTARAGQRGAVLVGVSTGGPRTLEEVLTQIPGDFPLPIVIAQHMPRNFTGALAERLNRISPLEVKELVYSTPLKAGQVLIARGDADVTLSERGSEVIAMSVPSDSQFRWHPSVEWLVQSAMRCFPPRNLIGVQLTGMGNDGAKALADLRRQGGHTIAESEESAIVFGMPKELIALGGAEFVLSAEKIAAQLASLV